MPTLTKFNHKDGDFQDCPEYTYVTLDNFWGEPIPQPTNSRIFADLKMYDIEPTVTSALRALEQRYPCSLVTVFGAPRLMGAIAAAKLRVEPVFVATLPPPEIKDKEAWRQNIIGHWVGQGCQGVLVDFPPDTLAEEYPGVDFFSVK